MLFPNFVPTAILLPNKYLKAFVLVKKRSNFAVIRHLLYIDYDL